MNKEPPYNLSLPSNLLTVLEHFEVNCVPACCGLCAYDFDPVYASHAIAARGTEIVESAVVELDSLLKGLKLLPHGHEVQSLEMNAQWPKDEAIAFFEMLQRDFQHGLALGTINPGDPHPRNDPDQRFTRD